MSRLLIFIVVVFAANHLMHSQDYWQHVHTNDTNSVISLKVANDGTIYYGGVKGLFISQDEGLTWDFKYLHNYVWLYSMEFDLDSNLIIGASYILYKYDRANDLFNIIETPPPSSNFNTIFIDSTTIFTDNDHDHILRYLDNEWTRFKIGDDVGSVQTIVKDTNDILYLGANGFDYGGGVFRSIDYGNTWEFFGLHHYYLQTLAIDSYNRLYAGAIGHVNTGNGGFFRYNYQTTSWDTLSNNARVQSLYFNKEDSLYAGIYSIGGDAGAWMSPDYGDTWINISSGLPDPSIGSNNVNAITLGPDNHLYAIVGNQKSIYKSTNTTIVQVDDAIKSSDLKISVYPNPFINRISVQLCNNNRVEYIKVQVFNLSGKMIQSKTFDAGVNKCTIVLDEIPVGIYLLNLQAEKYSFSKKIIKY